MWTWVSNFYKSNKYAIWWTFGYIFATWAIMQYMFNFNIFSRVRWWQLAHAHIHTFPGFVFCILILAAVPMYIATTIIIARTKAPLFNFKIPESIRTFFINAFTQTPMDEPTPESIPDATPAPQPEPVPEQTHAPESPKPIPDTVPSEMRVAYMNAREHIPPVQTSAFDMRNITKSATSTPAAPADTNNTNEMPIPTDFDIEDVDNIVDSVPTFTDISFDDDDDTDEIEITDVNQVSETTKPVAEYMELNTIPYTIQDDIVITDKFAIASHTDADFWVADDENWFAAGRTRQSPIAAVKRVAAEHKLIPVLYLGADNIMDIDTLRQEWTTAGIRIVTDLKDLI